ncbi:S-layer family protein [Neisseria meningitidis]|nr:S-layer family protein [Neisseria meningitidis]ARC10238.1 S-layer family protein [Neisseria meningitidis]
MFSRPSEISGKTGVTLSAPNANENSRISLSAANIEAENGKIKIQSYGDQYYYARQSELYTFERRSYKTGKWYNRKHITEVKEHKNAKPDAVNLSASQGIDIKSGGSIDAYATAFDAPKGSINIEAGRKLTLYAVEELNYDKLDSQKRRRFLGISYSKAHDTTTQVMKTALPSRVVAESANLQSGWDTKLQGTQFETTLGGATIRAGVGEQARADAKIILEGIKTTIHNETVSSSKSALWQKQAGRGSNIETLQLPSFTGPVAPVLTAPGGYIADIPKGNLKTEIETLTKQPEYAYLKQLQVAKNINWNQVQLAYDRWDYKQEGMTPAAAAVVVIVVTVLTYGALSAPAAAGTAGAAGAGAGGAAAGTAAGTGVAAGTAATTGVAAGTSAAAITTAAGKAALASLASQAAVSLINNKGDINHTLKELGKSSTVRQAATAAVTAGVLQGISGLNTQAAEAVSKHFHSPAAGKLTANLINSTAAASVHTAINGGSLKDNLEANILAALVNTAHGEAASKIKQLDQHYIAHKIAHAIAGCAAAAANKGKCQDGAIGAAVGEIVGEALVKNTDFSRMSATEIEKAKAKITAYSKLVAGTASAVVGGDVNTAANAAQIAVENNTLYPRCVGAKCDEFQKEQQKWIRENPEEYREVLLLQTGFIPIIGDIQSFVQAQTAADHLFALLGVVPGIGESIQAYKVAKAAKNLQGMKKALDKAATVATAQGYVSKTKIKIGQIELRVTAATDKQLLKAIGEGRDTTGKMTEQLFDSLAKQNGFRVLSGGKYGGNNGFDHVWQAADGSVVLIVESKQIRNGTVQLNPNGAGGYTQMSEDWIRQVLDQLPDGSPAKAAVFKANKNGTLKTAIAGVDRQTGKAVILPVKVPSKANIRR